MKILCLPYTHILSHISRPLLVANELRAMGHEVIFAGESPKISFIKNEGFEVVPIYEPDPSLLLDNIRNGKIQFVTDDDVAKMIQSDLTIYKEISPDIVLSDFRFTAPISTHLADLKHVAIVNGSSTEYRSTPFIPFFEWIPQWLIRRNSSPWEILDNFNIRLEMFLFDNVMSIFKKLSAKYKITRTVTATNCLTGKDITLLADIPEYFPTRDLPDNYYHVGPLTWKSALAPPLWWPPKKDGKPLIYITMGTTGFGDFFSRVYDLFKNSEFVSIITTGAQSKELQTIDGTIYSENFIDGDLAMEACDLAICHGGNGTIYQALQHGKPIIGIPTIPDQKYNMRRVEALGVGKMLTWKKFSDSPDTLLNLVRAMLAEETYYDNASFYKERISKYDAAKSAAEIITKHHF